LQGAAFLCPLVAILGAALQPLGFRNSQLQRSFALPVSDVGFFSHPETQEGIPQPQRSAVSLAAQRGRGATRKQQMGSPGPCPALGPSGPGVAGGERNPPPSTLPGALSAALTWAAICQAAKNSGYF